MNIIPIIAKADTIAKNELHKFKSKIMSELVSNGVQIYQFPTDEETVAEINATMSVSHQVRKDQSVIFLKAFVRSSIVEWLEHWTGNLMSSVESLFLLNTLLLSFAIYQMGELTKMISKFLPTLTMMICIANLVGRECHPSTFSYEAA